MVGISGLHIQWFTDYLHNRKQRVVLPGANFDRTSVNSGVSQGSILGPYFFFSSPEHEVLIVSYCDQSLSIVRRPCVVNRF